MSSISGRVATSPEVSSALIIQLVKTISQLPNVVLALGVNVDATAQKSIPEAPFLIISDSAN